MKIKILSDSTCDLSPELLERYDIGITPLCVIKNGEQFHDGIDIRPADIFAHVDAGGELCSTASVNRFEYEEVFEKFSKSHDAVIQITIGAGFSACYTNAVAAGEAYDNVYVVDSENLSTGQGHIVLAAAKMAEQGMDPESIINELHDMIPKVEASFLIDRLDYMQKGGRCSSVAALGATLLSLKPCIEVKNGKMSVVKKYRGSFEKCIRQYARERLGGRTDIRYDVLFIVHPAAAEEAVKIAKAAAEQYAGFESVYETRTGCTVACHCGPNTLGVMFVRK